DGAPQRQGLCRRGRGRGGTLDRLGRASEYDRRRSDPRRPRPVRNTVAVPPTTENDRSRERGRRLLIGLFVVYLVLLGWMVLWKFETPWVGAAALLPRPLKLVPFV